MSDDFKVVPIKSTQNLNAIKVLERALKQAKSGKIKAVAISWVNSGGDVGGDISAGDNNFYMMVSIRNTLRCYERIVFDEGD